LASASPPPPPPPQQAKNARREKTGRFFLVFLTLVCIGLLGWGASRIQNKDYAYKSSDSRINQDGSAKKDSPDGFVLSFLVGQIGGWVAWFFIHGIKFKYQ